MDMLALRSKKGTLYILSRGLPAKFAYMLPRSKGLGQLANSLSTRLESSTFTSMVNTYYVLSFPEASAAFPDRETGGNEFQLLLSQSRGKAAGPDPASHFFSRPPKKI